MKFKAQVGGLMTGLKPMHVIATKGIMKDSPLSGSITLNVHNQGLDAISDGGYVSGINTITNPIYNLDYECYSEGQATVNASDLISALSSFVPSDIVVIDLSNENGGSEVVIRSSVDNDEVQTLPILPNNCTFAKNGPSKKTKKSHIKLRRNVFLQYANKIAFAHGDQLQFKQYKYWLIRSFGNNSLRFVAGTGQIFAVVELEGANFVATSGDSNIMFPNDQTPTILSVLNDAKTDDIDIELHESYIYVDSGNIKIKIVNSESSIEWPDENKFLQRDSKFSFTTKVGNWKNAVKGIIATNNDEYRKQNKVHHCSLSIDLGKKIIQAKTTESSLKSNRKVPIEDIGTNEELKELSFKCASKYFSDIVSKASDDENLQFEMVDSSAPVVVRYYADTIVGDYRNFKKPDDNGLQERYSVFFAVAK
jgi:hypothetical protein